MTLADESYFYDSFMWIIVCEDKKGELYLTVL